MRGILFSAVLLISSPSWAQEYSTYVGITLSNYDTEFDTSGVDGSETEFGIHGGVRYGLQNNAFVEGELFYSIIDGETNSGIVDLESIAGATIGLGTYLNSNIYGLVFGGGANLNYDAPLTSENVSGAIVGVGFGVDITPQHTLGLRYSRIIFDDDVDDFNIDSVGIRYSYNF